MWQLYHALLIQVYSKCMYDFLESYFYFSVAGISDRCCLISSSATRNYENDLDVI